MKLSISIAEKLLKMMQGQKIPASSLQQEAVLKMIEDGVIQRLQKGSKGLLIVTEADKLQAYLHNQYGITDLETFVRKYTLSDVTRSEAVIVAGNSKIKAIRTFKGFLVNTYSVIDAKLHGKSFELHPHQGAYTFIHDYETFKISPSLTVVGVENAENFRHIEKQQHLFRQLNTLFVCRYPQSNDLVHWLRSIPNKYLHFGDLDFESINIYLHEYKKHLGNQSTFFIPPNTAIYLQQYGNRDLYNKQLSRMPKMSDIQEEGIHQLMILLHQHKKVLEQEVFIQHR